MTASPITLIDGPMSANACLRQLTNGRDLALSLRLVVLSKVTVNSNV
jgi:hypothetical protein